MSADRHDMAAMTSTPIKQSSVNKRCGIPLFPEILEVIFWYMDVGTFFIALQTCRQFAQAGSTRKNLLHQIRQIPGGQSFWEASIEDFGEDALQQRCCRYAAKSGCMAWVLANIRRRKLPPGTMTSKSAFSLPTPVLPSSSDSQKSYMALANKNGTIDIYSLTKSDAKLKMTLDLLTASPHTWTKIHALAFSRKGDLVVLHGRGIQICEHGGIDKHRSLGVFSQSSDDCRFVEVFELTTFYRCFDASLRHRKQPRRSQTIVKHGGDPISIALASVGDACILLGVRSDEMAYRYDIHLAKNTNMVRESLDPWDDYGTTYPRLSTDKIRLSAEDPESCSPMSIKFAEKEKVILMSRGSLPLYHTVSQRDSEDRITSTALVDNNQVRIGLVGTQPIWRDNFRMGTPFYHQHAPNHPKRLRVRTYCHSTYLALALMNIEPTHIEPVPHLYVLQLEETNLTTNCQRRGDIDRIFSADSWNPVALLAGWRCSWSTVGSLLETTPQGNRIASADWDRVLVWTIDPEALCQRDLGYFPARDYNPSKWLGRIRPILLPPQGVVHAMKWLDQDTLFALTDKGLVSWNVGPQASGQRHIDETGDEGLLSNPSSSWSSRHQNHKPEATPKSSPNPPRHRRSHQSKASPTTANSPTTRMTRSQARNLSRQVHPQK